MDMKLGLIIQQYYVLNIKTILSFFSMFSEENKKFIVSYFRNENKDFEVYSTEVSNILNEAINKLSKSELIKTIKIFLRPKVFCFIKKQKFVSPFDNLNPNSVPIYILKIFLYNSFYDCIIDSCIQCFQNVYYFKNHMENIDSNELFYMQFIVKQVQTLKDKLSNQLYYALLDFYISLRNKYDKQYNYIFPIMFNKDNSLYVSKILKKPYNDPNLQLSFAGMSIQPHLNELLFLKEKYSKMNKLMATVHDLSLTNEGLPKIKALLDNGKIHESSLAHTSSFDNLNNITYFTKMEKTGGSVTIPNNLVDMDKIEKLRNKIEDITEQAYVKNVYASDDIDRLETLLNNKKINNLIQTKKIKLAKNFQGLITQIMENNNSEDKNNNKNAKDFFDKVFMINDNDEKVGIDELYDIYNSEPDKQKFLDYLVDKISYYNYLRENDSPQPNIKSTRNSGAITSIGNVFSQILNNNYSDNSFRLKDNDMKFILMLETLNSLKTSLSEAQGNNVIVNLYKDVQHASVDKHTFNFVN